MTHQRVGLGAATCRRLANVWPCGINAITPESLLPAGFSGFRAAADRCFAVIRSARTLPPILPHGDPIRPLAIPLEAPALGSCQSPDRPCAWPIGSGRAGVSGTSLRVTSCLKPRLAPRAGYPFLSFRLVVEAANVFLHAGGIGNDDVPSFSCLEWLGIKGN